ncbi:MAG: MarR family transcriptional regulator [Candidatus Competibacteraceae bacterium]
MTQGQLGERLYLEKSSVSRLTDGLERRGWIIRIKDPKDSRQKLVMPTAKGLGYGGILRGHRQRCPERSPTWHDRE